MSRSWSTLALCALCAFPAATFAVGVGEPLGFTIHLQQGPGLNITKSVTIGPGQDLEDIKISDGDGESSTQIGTIPTGGPIALKVVTDDDPLYRILHMYIFAPASMGNLNAPGPVSLFNPSSGFPIDVSISAMTFDNGVQVLPQMANTAAYFSTYMRDSEGKFYQLAQANAFNSYGHGVNDIQVGADKYFDGDATQYNFAAAAGSPTSFAWTSIMAPTTSTPVHNGITPQLPAIPGYVYEIGLSVAFTAVPEPSVLAFLTIGGTALLFSRRFRR